VSASSRRPKRWPSANREDAPERAAGATYAPCGSEQRPSGFS
jgi:hypothetical protein